MHDDAGNITVAGFHDGVLPKDSKILESIQLSAFALHPKLAALRHAEAFLEHVACRPPFLVGMGATFVLATVFERRLGVPRVFVILSTADEDFLFFNEFAPLQILPSSPAACACI